jgi:pathogenesis-related protein 1
MRWGLFACVVACNGGSAAPDATGLPGDGHHAGDGSGSNPMHDGTVADVPGGVGEPAELAGMTLATNQVRAMVVTDPPLPSLQWDPQLASYAAAWLAMCQDTEAPIGLVDHDPNRTNVAGYPYIGENIYASSGAATAQDAVTDWASEGTSYDYATNTCASGAVCGHYTQLVWRTTTHVGCALKSCAGLAFPSTIVCDYGPGGNDGGKPY